MKEQDLEKKYAALMAEVERLRAENDKNEAEKAKKAKEVMIAKVHALYGRLDNKEDRLRRKERLCEGRC